MANKVAAEELTAVLVGGSIDKVAAISSLSKDVQDAIEAKSITAEVATKETRVKAEGQPTKLYAVEFLSLQANDEIGRAMLCAGNENPLMEKDGDKERDKTKGLNVTSLFNYAFDLRQRGEAGQRLSTLVEGPDRAYEKAASALVKAGLFSDLDTAIKHVRSLKG